MASKFWRSLAGAAALLATDPVWAQQVITGADTPASVVPTAEAAVPAEAVLPPVIVPEPALPTVAQPAPLAADPAAAIEAATSPAALIRRLPPSPPVDERQFPRYDVLAPNVAFWTRVFGEWSENQSVVHSSEYPNKVFEVLDFRNEALEMNPVQLSRYKAMQENDAKARVDKLLKQVYELRNSPDQLNEDQRRIWRMFADVRGDNKFKDAIGTFRCQRGLKERTALALQTSGSYLPEMESIFGSYRLPTQLTRLPLVESSFNVDAYSKVGAAGLWQFIPSSAKIYMRLNELVDDRRDPWTSTDAAARHLRDDYAALGAWPLALTAYNHGRGGVAKGLRETGGSSLPDLIRAYDSKSFGFASRNFYAEFLAASDVERNWKQHFGEIVRREPLRFDTVETKNYVPYETLRRLCDADDEVFRRLNPAYRPEVIEGKLYVPPGHLIRVPAGRANAFNVAYSKLGASERFDSQRSFFLLHKVGKGDSLGKIAKQYGVSQASVKSANSLKDANPKLKLGQVLKIPPHEENRPGPVLVAVGESKPTLTREQSDEVVAERVRDEQPTPKKPAKKSAPSRLHKVRSGQTLGEIAKRYKVSVADIRAANGINESNQIRVGQQLKIPAG
ncbi:MAG: LysM peptidoglycan-binding protein [Hydrocarboniphaga sp.]|uniref:lytic transglycosylase domain-containing protein n=1 Tax=Hydrocarboniphaga sp. TaxID=2033016 RepID=UPI00260883D6|nr:lytic transglycosylase domain-containing protein [Hydrocarboniphaga sp.]MDB5968294.1 LysM peptidoglycan-binding protein [Hydrocarboniphaga sp.]